MVGQLIATTAAMSPLYHPTPLSWPSRWPDGRTRTRFHQFPPAVFAASRDSVVMHYKIIIIIYIIYYINAVLLRVWVSVWGVVVVECAEELCCFWEVGCCEYAAQAVVYLARCGVVQGEGRDGERHFMLGIAGW